MPASVSTTSPGTHFLGVDLQRLAAPPDPRGCLQHLASALTLSSTWAFWRNPITALNVASPRQDDRGGHVAGDEQTDRGRRQQDDCMTSRYWRANAWKPDSFLALLPRLILAGGKAGFFTRSG